MRAAYEEGKGGIQVRAKMHIEDGRWDERYTEQDNGWQRGLGSQEELDVRR